MLRRRDHLYRRDESCRRKDAERSTKCCHSNDYEPDYAVQRLKMLLEDRRPKKASVSTKIFATRMVTRHIKRNKDPASPSYTNHAARRRYHIYRREDAPLAPRRQRCLPATEAAGSYWRSVVFDDDDDDDDLPSCFSLEAGMVGSSITFACHLLLGNVTRPIGTTQRADLYATFSGV